MRYHHDKTFDSCGSYFGGAMQHCTKLKRGVVHTISSAKPTKLEGQYCVSGMTPDLNSRLNLIEYVLRAPVLQIYLENN